jgi:hypothetical protein
MPYKINSQEISAVLSLSNLERCQHFVKRICDWEEVWALKNESGWVTSESEGRKCLAVWPNPAYAELFIKGDWENANPELIGLNSFIESWIPGMVQEGIYLGVFPNLELDAIVISADRILPEIRQELEYY